METTSDQASFFFIFKLFGWLSLISFGGAFGFIPEIQRILVNERHLLSREAFQHAFVLGQIVPGPNMALCASIGYHLAGWTGWTAAFFGIYTAPILIVSLASNLFQKYKQMQAVKKFEVALRPMILGLFIGATINLSMQSAGQDVISWALLVGLAGLAFSAKKIPPISIIFLGGILRILL